MFNRKRKLSRFKKSSYAGRYLNESPFRKKTYKPGTLTSRKPRKLSAKIKKILFLILFTAIVGFMIYIAFFSNFFLIKEINLKNIEIENQELADGIKKTIHKSIGTNLIFVDNQELQSKILNSFPELEKITLKKSYPSTLEIEFSKYPLAANLINESATIKKCYIVNSIGYIVKENYENKALPYIRIKSDEVINPKTAAIEATKLKYILDSMKYFTDKFGMKVREAEYLIIAREIHLLTEKNFYIWLDTHVPMEDQFKKLKKALVKLDIYHENLEYIDLRIAGNNGDKIIYKRKN